MQIASPEQIHYTERVIETVLYFFEYIKYFIISIYIGLGKLDRMVNDHFKYGDYYLLWRILDSIFW